MDTWLLRIVVVCSRRGIRPTMSKLGVLEKKRSLPSGNILITLNPQHVNLDLIFPIARGKRLYCQQSML